MNDQQQKIRVRAHAIWEQEGRPDGREREHWERAEQELLSEQESPGGGEAAASSRAEDIPASSVGSAPGLSPGGTTPGGGPGRKGSVGTGGGSTGGRATGSPGKVGR